MPRPDFPKELGNIPYSKILGAPLNAAVEANAEASETAAQFIQDVAFKESEGFDTFGAQREPVYVNFHYRKDATNAEGEVETQEFQMKIPLLLLLHVPYFEVNNVTVDFNVSLNSVHAKRVETEGGGGGSVGGLLGGIIGFNVGGSYQRTEKRQQKIERKYDQSVHIEAGSIEAPTGVTRLLDVLEQTITETSEEEASGGGE
ncbi:DUF2589 domain-containing protein [Halovivax limisalsi]|uniref:DUF2589 domain-containing protein n=1 Tax=Halovivax limisalsi TaxID=1453760 RepID=UPI001FFDBAA6|nr:DUF2589 domain-containing protein [Halovivax limisalsi]